MSTGRVVVTGASSGIGRACALRFSELGYEVFAGVRNAGDAEALCAAAPDRIRPVFLDVTDPAAIDRAVAALGGEPIAGLVNAAGIAVIGPLELVPLEELRRQFEVNVIGVIAVIRAFLPSLRLGPGRIVNVGSVAGRSALPGTGAYDASKFAIEGLTDTLRLELHAFGIGVSVIEPGAVATAIWRKSVAALATLRRDAAPEHCRLYDRLLAAIAVESARSERGAISPAAVVRAIEHALTARRPKTRYPVGRDARFWLLLNLLPDRLRDALILSRT